MDLSNHTHCSDITQWNLQKPYPLLILLNQHDLSNNIHCPYATPFIMLMLKLIESFMFFIEFLMLDAYWISDTGVHWISDAGVYWISDFGVYYILMLVLI